MIEQPSPLPQIVSFNVLLLQVIHAFSFNIMLFHIPMSIVFSLLVLFKKNKTLMSLRRF